MSDAVGDVVPRPPAKQSLRALDARIGPDGVTWPPLRLAGLDPAIGHAVKRVEKLPDRGTGSGAQVDGRGRPGQRLESGQGGHVRGGQVPDMDIVPDAGAIAGWPVSSCDQERLAFFVRLKHLAEGMTRSPQLQAGTHFRIRAYRVEVPQGQHADEPGGGDIGEHRLAHRLGPGVGALRVDGRALVNGEVIAGAVDRGR